VTDYTAHFRLKNELRGSHRCGVQVEGLVNRLFAWVVSRRLVVGAGE
jgi:hypothetical protein